MDVLAVCEELSIFQTDLIIDLIDYKWERYGAKSHYFGCFVHWFYIGILIYYIDVVFLYDDDYELGEDSPPNKTCLYLIIVALLQPIYYQARNMIK